MPAERSTFSRWIGARGIPGVASIAAAGLGLTTEAAAFLAGAVAADLIVEGIARRRRWERGTFEVQLEGFVDFVCFIWAPVSLALIGETPVYLAVMIVPFIAAGGYRIARFNVEGLVSGGYRGLPVTYNGVTFPLALLVARWIDGNAEPVAFAIALGLGAFMMPSGSFVTPRIRP